MSHFMTFQPEVQQSIDFPVYVNVN